MKKLKQIGFAILIMIPVGNIMKCYYPNGIWGLSRDEQFHYWYIHSKEILWYLRKDYPHIWKLTTYFYPGLKELS